MRDLILRYRLERDKPKASAISSIFSSGLAIEFSTYWVKSVINCCSTLPKVSCLVSFRRKLLKLSRIFLRFSISLRTRVFSSFTLKGLEI